MCIPWNAVHAAQPAPHVQEALGREPRQPRAALDGPTSAAPQHAQRAQLAIVACLAGRAAAYLYRKWAGDAWAALQVLTRTRAASADRALALRLL